MPIRPRALDQHVSNAAVASLGDAASSDRRTGRPFFRNEARIPHELARALKPLHISDFGGERHGDDQIDPPQSLKSLNNRRQGPGRHKLLDHPLQSLDPLLRCRFR